MTAFTTSSRATLQTLPHGATSLFGTNQPRCTENADSNSALAAEVAQEFSIRREAKQPVDDLLNLVGEIIPFGMLKLPSNSFTQNRLQTLVIMQNPMHAIF